MRSMPVELATELSAEEHSIVHLIELNFRSGVQRYTDYNEDIFYQGNWYYSRGIEFDEAKYSILPKVDKITFSIDNVDWAITSIIAVEDIRNRLCTIEKAAINLNLGVIGSVTLFVGYIDQINGDEQKVRIDVYNHFIKWRMSTPRRQHESSCPWTFKDNVTCRYQGTETWCDFSWDRCLVLGNHLNFGGNKWLLNIQNKQIWWGRKQS